MKKTICIARLRSNVNYTQPIEYINDYWYEMIKKFIENHSDKYDFTFYNFGFNQKPVRDLTAIKTADFIIIPSEAEFQYHIPHYIPPQSLSASNDEIKKIRKVFSECGQNKTLILLTADRKDTIDLYRTRVFPEFSGQVFSIDENEITGAFTAYKYWLIQNYFKSHFDFYSHAEKSVKDIDLCYYGCDKSKDVGGKKSEDLRGDIIHALKKSEKVKIFHIGNLKKYKYRPDMKWQRDMRVVFPFLERSLATLCFNWPGYPTSITARYAEAMACGTIPLVWKEYDIDNRVVADSWQRCYSVEDVENKLVFLRDDNFREQMFSKIKTKYLQNILSIDQYNVEFERKLSKFLV